MADRVVMTAAKLDLETVFEAGFTEASYGFRPKKSAIDACEELYGSRRIDGRNGFSRPISATALERSTMRRLWDRLPGAWWTGRC